MYIFKYFIVVIKLLLLTTPVNSYPHNSDLRLIRMHPRPIFCDNQSNITPLIRISPYWYYFIQPLAIPIRRIQLYMETCYTRCYIGFHISKVSTNCIQVKIEVMSILSEHKRSVNCVKFSPVLVQTLPVLASCDDDGVVCLWTKCDDKEKYAASFMDDHSDLNKEYWKVSLATTLPFLLFLR